MAKKLVNVNLTVILLVLVGLMAYNMFANAGGLNPSAPPSSTMTTRDEIYDAGVAGAYQPSQREGYMRTTTHPTGLSDIITVPQGKCFVLRKVRMYHSADSLYVDNEELMNWGTFDGTPVDLPDSCAVIYSGQVLRANSHSGSPFTIVGYFQDE